MICRVSFEGVCRKRENKSHPVLAHMNFHNYLSALTFGSFLQLKTVFIIFSESLNFTNTKNQGVFMFFQDKTKCFVLSMCVLKVAQSSLMQHCLLCSLSVFRWSFSALHLLANSDIRAQDHDQILVCVATSAVPNWTDCLMETHLESLKCLVVSIVEVFNDSTKPKHTVCSGT